MIGRGGSVFDIVYLSARSASATRGKTATEKRARRRRLYAKPHRVEFRVLRVDPPTMGDRVRDASGHLPLFRLAWGASPAFAAHPAPRLRVKSHPAARQSLAGMGLIAQNRISGPRHYTGCHPAHD